MNFKMSRFALWLALAVILAAGCKKPDATPAAAGDSQDPSNMAPPSPRGAGPMPVAATAAVVTDTGDANATLQQLSAELRNYVVRTRSIPKNFDEFASKSNLQFPPPPAGKKYAISGQAVVLVKR